jgi:2-keto-4-pentenoate hydratase
MNMNAATAKILFIAALDTYREEMFHEMSLSSRERIYSHRMTEQDIQFAATTLWRNWQQSLRIPKLPERVRPVDRAEAYAIQARLADLSGQSVAGWKIAATSLAGQSHIRVDGPLAGRLLKERVLENGAVISLRGNLMRVAEAEFAFRFRRDLEKRKQSYSLDEVLSAVESLHAAIEVPDSRYEDYRVVGAPQLIADNACACWFILGPPVEANWREFDLAKHKVDGYRNGELISSGSGANVLGDPRAALAWIADELSQFGDGLLAGQVVTTGTCITPIPVAPGDHVRMDFGAFGSVEARFS